MEIKSTLSPETEQAVREFFSMGLSKPDEILRNLRAKKIIEPPKHKLKYFLKKLRDETNGKKIDNLNDLTEWIAAHSSNHGNGNPKYIKLLGHIKGL